MRVRAVNGPEKEKPIGTKGPTSTPSDTHTPTGVGGVGGGEKEVRGQNIGHQDRDSSIGPVYSGKSGSV